MPTATKQQDSGANHFDSTCGIQHGRRELGVAGSTENFFANEELHVALPVFFFWSDEMVVIGGLLKRLECDELERRVRIVRLKLKPLEREEARSELSAQQSMAVAECEKFLVGAYEGWRILDRFSFLERPDSLLWNDPYFIGCPVVTPGLRSSPGNVRQEG